MKRRNKFTIDVDVVPVIGLAAGFRKEDRFEMILILPFLVMYFKF